MNNYSYIRDETDEYRNTKVMGNVFEITVRLRVFGKPFGTFPESIRSQLSRIKDAVDQIERHVDNVEYVQISFDKETAEKWKEIEVEP